MQVLNMVKTTPLQKLPSCVQRLVLVSLICLSSIVVSCIQVRGWMWIGPIIIWSFHKKFKLISHLTQSIIHYELSVPQCPVLLVCLVPMVAVYWYIQHFYR